MNGEHQYGQISNVIFSTHSLEECIDSNIIRESAISKTEFYELLIDAIVYITYSNDSVENFLYYWAFSENPNLYWRSSILPCIYNEIADYIKQCIDVLRVDNPELLDLIVFCGSYCQITLRNKSAMLSF